MQALAAAAVILGGGATSAAAADLGGNCCADLEERIAELEATTARKGNRKVSLEVSGHVNEAVLFWDDGRESNVGVYTNDNSRSRVRFKGKAKIDSDWEAGYLLEIGVRIANSKRFTQNDETGPASDVGLDLRESSWYIKNKTYGGMTVGLTSTSTDGITELNLTQTSSFSKYSDVEDTGLGLLLRSSVNGGLSNSGGGISFRRLIGDAGDQPGDGDKRFNQVKYETPVFQGFSASASWGEDDFWDVGLRYAGEFSGFKIAAGIGYLQITDGPETKVECAARGGGLPRSDENCHQFGGSVSLLHEETGLFVNVGAGQKIDDALDRTTRFTGTGADDKQTFWAMQAGIEKKFNAFGKTTIYGEYYDYNGGAIRRDVDGTDPINPLGLNAVIWDTGLQTYGAGIAQGFDSAAMVVYLSYRHVEADLAVRQIVGGNASGAIADAQLDDLDLLFTGAIIKF